MSTASTSASPFTPKLTTTDWGEEWKRLQLARQAADDPAYWNERSKTFSCGKIPSPYADRFIELAGIREGETVLDMGCGTGALSIPLAMAGHEVIAADFSSGMLERLGEECATRGLNTVTTKLMSWEDDWGACGVGENSVDVACASRSIATADLRDSLTRLSRVARRRACITLSTGCSPRADERIMQAMGIGGLMGRDFLYAFVLLTDMGYRPEVNYIDSERDDTYATKEEAFENLAKMVTDAPSELISTEAAAFALKRLSAWLDDNLIANEQAGAPDENSQPQKALKLAHPRTISWAHIAWNTCDS